MTRKETQEKIKHIKFLIRNNPSISVPGIAKNLNTSVSRIYDLIRINNIVYFSKEKKMSEIVSQIRHEIEFNPNIFLSVIGRKLNLTRERIRQIVKKNNINYLSIRQRTKYNLKIIRKEMKLNPNHCARSLSNKTKIAKSIIDTIVFQYNIPVKKVREYDKNYIKDIFVKNPNISYRKLAKKYDISVSAFRHHANKYFPKYKR